jgi:hypothetical protein
VSQSLSEKIVDAVLEELKGEPTWLESKDLAIFRVQRLIGKHTTVEMVFAERDTWPPHIREFFEKQKAEIERRRSQ